MILCDRFVRKLYDEVTKCRFVIVWKWKWNIKIYVILFLDIYTIYMLNKICICEIFRWSMSYFVYFSIDHI